MTDSQPPQGQPDFQPPGWQPPQQQDPSAPQQPPQQPAQQPAQPPPGPPAPPYYAPPPGSPPGGGRGSIWLGIGITFATMLGWWGITAGLPSDNPLASTMNALILVLPIGLVLAGIVLAAIPRTTRTGAGVLIGIGAGVLILGGICVALLVGYNG